MDRTVSVAGSATLAVAPDTATLTCGVQVEGTNAQDVLHRSNSAVQAILDAVAGNGVAAADVRTNGPNLWPGERGYHGSNDVTVVVRDLATVGQVVDAVAVAGGPNLTLHGVAFSIADPSAHLPAVRRAAIDAALATASDLASAAGAAVGEVVTIVESAGSAQPVMMKAAMRMAATPVSAGSQELRVDVQVTYRLVAG